VGFQCPDCVAEGSRSVRSARTTFGGLRPTNAAVTSMALIAVNVAVWAAIVLTGAGSSRLVDLLALRANGFCDLGGGFANFVVDRTTCTDGGGTWLPGVSDGAYWQLVTSAFTHVQVLHIAFNMFALYLFGPQLEVFFGRARFLALYLISALTGSAFVYWLGPEYTPTLGASGAIYGLMGALLVVSLKARVNVQGVLTLIGINVLLTFSLNSISWQGHLGGLVGGLLVTGVLVYAPRTHRTQLQVAGLSAITALTVVAIVARTAALA